MRRAVFNIESIDASADGIEEFFWPLRRDEVLATRDHFMKVAVQYLRSELQRSRAADIFGMVLLAAYLGELLTLYQGQAVIRRSRQAGFMPVVPVASRVMESLAHEKIPAETAGLRMLRAGVRRPSQLRRILRDVNDRIRVPVIARRRLSHVDLFSDIVTIAYGEMILQHAAAISDVVRFVRFEEWFLPVVEAQGPDTERASMVEATLEISAGAFAAGGEPFGSPVARYLRNWLDQALHLAAHHVRHIESRSELIPKKLWRGTGGHLFGRTLSYAVQRTGGVVIGHDHAMGHGIFDSFGHSIVEYPLCDRFMVWTDVQRQTALRSIRPDMIVQETLPTIEVVPGVFKPKISQLVRRPVGGGPAKVRRIMYVGTLFGETVHATPLIPDVVLVDWEARLVAHLRSWGYDVMVKPHPESTTQSVDVLKRLGARSIGGRFEDVYQQGDVVVFGQMNATSFFSLLGTNHPCVVADTGLHRLQPEALEMLQRRCGYVRCEHDEKNRLDIDWDALKIAIELAPSLSDQSLYHAYFQSNRGSSGDAASRAE